MSLKIFAKTAPVCLALIVAFVGYAVLQVIMGVNIDSPSNADLIRFGANVLPLSIGDEPWRLVASGFLHIGLMHLVFNGFAMYFFGQVAEQFFGSWRFLALFLLSVVAGNLLSNYVTWQGVLSGGALSIGAGASGGIMGLGASLLALSFVPRFAKILNRKSLATVMAVNLLIGFVIQGIDNFAHIGGAICGAILGVVFGYCNPTKSLVVCLGVLVVLMALWWGFVGLLP